MKRKTLVQLEQERAAALVEVSRLADALRGKDVDLGGTRRERDNLAEQLQAARTALQGSAIAIARLEGYIARVVQVDQSTETRTEGSVFGIPSDNGSHYQQATHYSSMSRVGR